jgi:hypothetical protein
MGERNCQTHFQSGIWSVPMKTAIFWDVTAHNLVQTHHHFLESTNANFREENMCIVKMKYISPKHL